MARINVYVVGYGTGYANWLLNNPDGENGILVNNMKEADLVLLTGGGDVHASFYGRRSHPQAYGTRPSDERPTRDQQEWEAIAQAVALGKPMWGTCRGLQIMCAYAGGDLIQHMSHSGNHDITFYDGQTTVRTNTIHHQMIYPFEKLTHGEDYYIVANSLGLSPFHYGESNEDRLELPVNKDGLLLEPEAGFFPKINGFGQQSHLEMQDFSSPVVRITRKLVDHQIKGELSYILENNIPIIDVLNPEFTVEKVVKGEFILS